MSNYTMSPVVNGEKKQMIVKVGDTLPIGAEMDYDGSVVPDGWEEVEKNILWENPNPGNSFAGQTITLSDNISNYDEYEVIYIYSTGSTRAFSSRLPKTEGTLLLGFVSYISRRGVSSPSGTTLQIDDCTTYTTYGSNTTTTNNSLLIPIKIIGYKKQIKKIAPVTPANGNIKNSYGTSQTDTYSQEYINKFTDYSTTEQVVGKWKDGKPIYRTIIEYTLSIDTSTYFGTYTGAADLIKSIDTLVDYKFYVYNGTLIFPVPNGGGGNNDRESGIYIQRSYGGIGFQCYANSINNYNGKQAQIILEYTKTTD